MANTCTRHDLSPDCTYSCHVQRRLKSYSLACQHPDVSRKPGAMSDYDSTTATQKRSSQSFTCTATVSSTTTTVISDPGATKAYLTSSSSGRTWAHWRRSNHPSQPQIIDFSSVDFFRYFGAPEGQEFHHYRVNGGGHTWFGRKDIDSTELLWIFPIALCWGIQRHSLKPSWCNGQSTDCACSPIARAVDLQVVWNWANAHEGLESAGTL